MKARDEMKYSKTPVTWTLKGNKNQFELAGFGVIGVDLIRLKSGFKSKGNGSLFELAGLFELSEFELLGFYCTSESFSITE